MNDSFALNVRQLANHLLLPDPLSVVLNSGVFAQVTSSDQSARFFWELAPMLEIGGMPVVIEDAAKLMNDDGLAYLSEQFAKSSGMRLPVNAVGSSTFSDCVIHLIESSACSYVLLLGGAQCLASEPGERILSAIKAARDCVNLRPGAAERFLVVATWFSPDSPAKYVGNSRSAFYGATALTLADDGPRASVEHVSSIEL